MKTAIKISTAILFAVALVLPAVAKAGMFEYVSKSQQTLKSVSAKFKQVKHTELLGRPVKSSGTFKYRPDIGVRWDYTDQMAVIYDGEDLYLHYFEMEQAERVRGAKGFVGPLGFNIALLKQDYKIEAIEDKGILTLVLIPGKEMPFTKMEMEFKGVGPFPEKVTVFEEGGDRTEIFFKDVVLDGKIAQEVFIFTPPKGINIRERNIN